MKNEIIIRLRDDEFPEVTRFDEKGGKITRTIHPDDLYTLMNFSQVVPKVEWLDSPLLPGRMRYAKASDGTEKVMIYREKGNHDMWLAEQKMENVAFPSLLFVFLIREGTIIGKYVCAVKDESVKGSSKIFRYPYSNVFENGSCCWFGLPQIKELWQLETLPDLFFLSPDTTHNYDKANLSGMWIRELIEKYQGREFPDKFLKPMNETVDEFWKRIG